ncbi:GTPase IMAP family member 3-like [Trachinotus anak]|uniref:GTPase IMAP family member 3-like n=1 Tax=Trachinotus anak TaxID=443729 RepID=UPI0039F24DDD
MEEERSKVSKRTEERKSTPTRKRKSDNSESQSHQERKSGSKKPKEQRVNLVLLGMSGTGKSASGNTILRNKHFESRASSKQVTTECQLVEAEIYGRPVRVIDTPDIFDDDIKPSDKDKHVERCNELCQSDPRVFLLVMQVGRFTDGERNVLEKLDKAFGVRAREQTIILFTCGEELQRDGMTLEEFLRSCQPGLKMIIEKCGYRCLTFENRASGSDQSEKLMQTVSRLLETQRK